MQKKDTKNLRKRSRLYQAQLDVSLLEPGTVNFNQLNDSCFILIAPFDLFGKGLYRYTFEGMCRECPELKIEDGAVRVFINTKGEEPGGFFRGIPGFHEVYHGGGGAYGQRADQADTPRDPEGEGIGEDGGEVHAGLGREGIGT